jgi:hypothetical protein
MAMKFGPTANPQQVDAMGRVVSAYCKHMGVKSTSPEGERVAEVVLALHEAGIRGENALLGALIVPREPNAKDALTPKMDTSKQAHGKMRAR